MGGDAESMFDYGVLPLESSSGGIIPGVFEELLSHLKGGLQIVAEFAAFDELCLAGAAGTDKTNAVSVHCHPQLLTACSGFLTSIDDSRIEAGETSYSPKPPRHPLVCL